MKTFREFIFEVKPPRDFDKAARLGKYVAKRQGHWRSYDIDGEDHSYGYIDFKGKASPTHGLDDKIGNKTRFPSYSEYPTQDVPVKDLTPTQYGTNFSQREFNWKFNDDTPAPILKHEGKHYIWNGHHRYIAARLARRETIPGKVLSVDPFTMKIKPPKKS